MTPFSSPVSILLIRIHPASVVAITYPPDLWIVNPVQFPSRFNARLFAGRISVPLIYSSWMCSWFVDDAVTQVSTPAP
jgi:hypothetical protein